MNRSEAIAAILKLYDETQPSLRHQILEEALAWVSSDLSLAAFAQGLIEGVQQS